MSGPAVQTGMKGPQGPFRWWGGARIPGRTRAPGNMCAERPGRLTALIDQPAAVPVNVTVNVPAFGSSIPPCGGKLTRIGAVTGRGPPVGVDRQGRAVSPGEYCCQLWRDDSGCFGFGVPLRRGSEDHGVTVEAGKVRVQEVRVDVMYPMCAAAAEYLTGVRGRGRNTPEPPAGTSTGGYAASLRVPALARFFGMRHPGRAALRRLTVSASSLPAA